MRIGLICVALISCAACEDPPPTPFASDGTSSIRFLADGTDEGFTRVLAPRAFVFPLDHASHPDYRTEWWYFTGNLFAADGRHFGFELTFFRIALAPQQPPRTSNWAANQIWMAHFAVTDTANGRFIAHERFARGALGLAGATSEPLRIWLEDWSAAGTATDSTARLHLSARHENLALELDLVAEKPPVLHGDRGVDAKGPEAGNASYYYSLPRLRASGTVQLNTEASEVEGLAWMDREWGTSALSPGVTGWDWFALHLNDGQDLMFYRLRNVDGSASPFSGGTLIDAHGGRHELDADDVALTALREWQSPQSGARYPIAWRLSIPQHAIDVTIEPRMEDQEIDLTVRYWEGAVRATATANGAPAGNGYLELAGY